MKHYILQQNKFILYNTYHVANCEKHNYNNIFTQNKFQLSYITILEMLHQKS